MSEFLDSFDDRATADIGAKYSIYNVTTAGVLTITITSSAGRNGTNGLRLARAASAASPSWEAFRTMPSASRYHIAMARRWSTLPPAGQYRSIASVRDSGTTQVELRLYGDGSINLYRSGSVVTGGAGVAGQIVANTYYHIEWDVTIHNTSGASEVKINETTTAFTVTNQNTRVSANNSANEVGLREVASSSSDASYNADMDDVIFHDQTSYVGDQRVGYCGPSGAGTYADFTANGAGTLTGCINEASQDGNTTYISDATVGHKATFALADVPVSATIKFVQQVYVAEKTDAGTRAIAPRTKSGGSEVTGADLSLSTTYAYLLQMTNIDPATGVTWTPAGFNAAEMGPEVTS